MSVCDLRIQYARTILMTKFTPRALYAVPRERVESEVYFKYITLPYSNPLIGGNIVSSLCLNENKIIIKNSLEERFTFRRGQSNVPFSFGLCTLSSIHHKHS